MLIGAVTCRDQGNYERVRYVSLELGKALCPTSGWYMSWASPSMRKKMQKPVTALSASRFCTSNLLTSCRFYSNETAGFLAGPDVVELVDKDVLIFSCFCFCSAVFEEPEDPSNRSFFSEIISSISDVKFSHSGRYIMTRDYLTVKVWDLNMENRPIETYQVRTTTYPQVHKALPLQASISASGWKAYNAQE